MNNSIKNEGQPSVAKMQTNHSRKWVNSLPRRWMRNGLTIGFLIGLSSRREFVPTHVYLFTIAVTSMLLALIFWLAGYAARKSLPIATGDWELVHRRIVRNWLIGSLPVSLFIVVLGLLTDPIRIPSDVPQFWLAVVWIGVISGQFGIGLLLGWLIAIASRFGLKRAMARDGI